MGVPTLQLEILEIVIFAIIVSLAQVTMVLNKENVMPFIKQGEAPISVVKCSCGQTLASVNDSCPKCGRNLRPLSKPDEKPAPEAKPERK